MCTLVTYTQNGADAIRDAQAQSSGHFEVLAVRMAKKLPASSTLSDFILKLINLFVEHNWLALQTLIVISVLTVSLYVIAFPHADDQARKWAYGSMTTLMGVWIGTRLCGGPSGKTEVVRVGQPKIARRRSVRFEPCNGNLRRKSTRVTGAKLAWWESAKPIPSCNP